MTFAGSAHCRSGVHCGVCRDGGARGERFRQEMAVSVCPLGKPLQMALPAAPPPLPPRPLTPEQRIAIARRRLVVLASPEVQTQRASLCQRCEHHGWRDGFEICQACGCGTGSVERLRTRQDAACPDRPPRW